MVLIDFMKACPRASLHFSKTLHMKYFFLPLAFLFFLSCDDSTSPISEEDKPTISIDDLSVKEGDDTRPLFLSIRLSKASSSPVTLVLQSLDGSAMAGEDFAEIQAAELTFEPGDVLEEYRLEIFGDEEPEANESFTVVIQSADGAEVDDSSASIELLNDDIDTNFDIPTTGNTSPLSYPGMSLIWQDEFDESAIDENFWNFEIGTGNNGWGNNELQFYREENTFLKEGHLVIEAREENYVGRDYTSSRMTTQGKFDFQYGRVDIRAALPQGQGIWPALWMLGANFSSIGWPHCGEIDIMELLGHEPNKVHGTIHWADENNQHSLFGGYTTLSSGNFVEKFHVFSIIWEENKITWLVDDAPYHTANLDHIQFDEFRDPFFLIFNVAVGGNWPGSPDASTLFPQRMIVDYVRVFQPN